MVAPGIVKVAVAMSPAQNHLDTTLILTKAITAHTSTRTMIPNQLLAATITTVKKDTTNKATANKILSSTPQSLILKRNAPYQVQLG